MSSTNFLNSKQRRIFKSDKGSFFVKTSMGKKSYAPVAHHSAASTLTRRSLGEVTTGPWSPGSASCACLRCGSPASAIITSSYY